MCQVDVKIPEEVLYDTRMSKVQAQLFARRAVAMAYYVQSGVSIGYCAEIAGMSKADFIAYLGKNKISIFHYDDENEFDEELNNA